MIGNVGFFLQELKFGARSLARAKGLTATVVVTLALGIGANAAMSEDSSVLPVANSAVILLFAAVIASAIPAARAPELTWFRRYEQTED